MAKIPLIFLEKTAWDQTYDSVWLTSSLLLKRNISRYKFPSKLSTLESTALLGALEESVKKEVLFTSSLFIPLDQLDPIDKEFMFEYFLFPEGFTTPAPGQGFLCDAEGNFVVLFNMKDHVNIQLLHSSCNLEEAWVQLGILEKTVGKHFEFSYSARFGYLTSTPRECGTGLIVSLFLHVPALIHSQKLHEALTKHADEQILPSSLEGSLNECAGDILILKNRYTLGLSEETLLNSLQNTALKMISAEKAARARILEKGDLEIKDLVSRAYGLLSHSYQLQTKEALGALSLLRLGLELGWVQGISPQACNRLFSQCRRGHQAYLLHETTEIPQKRAAFIRTALHGTTFIP